jgi:toxin ParE1/3/4
VKKLRWTTLAQADFKGIFGYLEGEAGEQIASTQCSRIIEALHQLQRFPDSGVPSESLSCRKLLAQNTPYIIYHRLRNDIIEILTIRHTSRKPLKRIPRI